MDLRFYLRRLAGEKLPPVRVCVSGLSRSSCSTGDKASMCGSAGQESVCDRGWAWPRVGGAEGAGEGPDDNTAAWLN